MDIFYVLKVIGALAFVLGLFYMAVMIFKKLQPSYFNATYTQPLSLKVEEQIYLGPKHKISVVGYKNKKYILLLGETALVIDTVENHKK